MDWRASPEPRSAVGRARRSGRPPTARCPEQRAEPCAAPQPVDVGVGSRLQLIHAARHVGQSEAARRVGLRYAQRFAVLDGSHLCLSLRSSLGIDDLAVQYPRGLQGHVTHFGDRRPRRSRDVRRQESETGHGDNKCSHGSGDFHFGPTYIARFRLQPRRYLFDRSATTVSKEKPVNFVQILPNFAPRRITPPNAPVTVSPSRDPRYAGKDGGLAEKQLAPLIPHDLSPHTGVLARRSGFSVSRQFLKRRSRSLVSVIPSNTFEPDKAGAVDFAHFDSVERRAESGERRAESGERERRAESGERRAESGERRGNRGGFNQLLWSWSRRDGLTSLRLERWGVYVGPAQRSVATDLLGLALAVASRR